MSLRFQFGTSKMYSHAHIFAERHHSNRPDSSENPLCAWYSRDAGCRSRPALCCFDQKSKQSRQAKRKPLSLRFHVPTFARGTAQFEVPDWNLKIGRGGRRYAPYVFTEQGVAMLSSVLRSGRAVQVNVAIMRTFVRLREMLATHEELRRKIDAMEKRYDARFQAVFDDHSPDAGDTHSGEETDRISR